MKTVKFRINAGTDHYDRELGPPLPRSLQVWENWGCDTHQDCISYTNGPKFEVVIHCKPENLFDDEPWSGHAETCQCWRHWVRGEIEAPGHENTDDFKYPLERIKPGPKSRKNVNSI